MKRWSEVDVDRRAALFMGSVTLAFFLLFYLLMEVL